MPKKTLLSPLAQNSVFALVGQRQNLAKVDQKFPEDDHLGFDRLIFVRWKQGDSVKLASYARRTLFPSRRDTLFDFGAWPARRLCCRTFTRLLEPMHERRSADGAFRQARGIKSISRNASCGALPNASLSKYTCTLRPSRIHRRTRLAQFRSSVSV